MPNKETTLLFLNICKNQLKIGWIRVLASQVCGLEFKPQYHIKQKQTSKDLNERPTRGKQRRNVSGDENGKGFFKDKTSVKAQETKAQTDKWYCIKLKSFDTAKGGGKINKLKKQPSE
jgi:hypothetical protein